MSRKRRQTGGNPARPTVAPADRPNRPSRPPQPSAFSPTAYLGEQPPAGDVGYLQTLRTADWALWRPVLGVVFAVVLYFTAVTLISQILLALSWVVSGGGTPFADYTRKAIAFEVPGGMLATNLAIACLIPVSFVVIMVVHRVRPRWLGSVQPRLRWRYLLISLGIAAVSFAVVLAATTLATPGAHFQPQRHFWIYLIIILLTSPLQAAGEEYLFRGYLLQAFGSIMRSPWFGIVTSSVVFALFHGTQNVPLFIDRLAFGLLAALLVHRTGGIEAGIAAHAINNVYAFGLAGLTGTIAQARGLQEIGWVNAGVDVGGFALFALLAWLAAGRMRLRTTTPPTPA